MMAAWFAAHWITVLEFFGAFLGITGAFFNARRDSRGFIAWMFANTALMVCDLHAGLYWQAALMFSYTFLCFYGLWQWRKASVTPMAEEPTP